MTEFFQELPPKTGMAFVVTQHLDPGRTSALPALLSRVTVMPVSEARDNVRIAPNHVYVTVSNTVTRIAGRRLSIALLEQEEAPRRPIDHLLTSVAETWGDQSIGVIMSGNGTDGTDGLRAIKAAGGLTFAQDSQSAKHPPMPANAAASGSVDIMTTPAKIAQELAALAGRRAAGSSGGAEKAASAGLSDAQVVEDILKLLHQRMGVDFTHYKRQTLERRIRRRVGLGRHGTLGEYLQRLGDDPLEVQGLFNDIMIQVTGFFRDGAVFQVLRRKVFPRLLKGRKPEEPIRVWVPGCSTGEEVYSLAIALVEFLAEKKAHFPLQIFGTDVNSAALERARRGFFPAGIAADVSAERLREFFSRSGNGYQINESIREKCVFARQNVVADPPFSNLDVVSCRNLLIYLGQPLQRKVIPLFHYALKPAGCLLLGATETTGSFGELFQLLDRKCKIYGRRATHNLPMVTYRQDSPEAGAGSPAPARRLNTALEPSLPGIQKQADRLLLSRFCPPGVIINRKMQVLHFRGRTGPFLEHSQGEADLNLLKMAREGMAIELQAGVNAAIRKNKRIKKENVRVRINGTSSVINFEVIPFEVPQSTESYYLVTFEQAADMVSGKAPGVEAGVGVRRPGRGEAQRLRAELAATRESLEAIIEEQEATNEELRSANEEIMSSNEELETAKEELQSTNEALTTLNDELECRNSEMEDANNNLHNLLASVDIPVVMVAADMRIRRFTSVARKLLNLIPGDIGRPFTDLQFKIDLPDLGKVVTEVIDSLQANEFEAKDQDGHWWSIRVRPYKTTNQKIDGAVIAFVDVDVLKKYGEQMRQGREFAKAVVETVREPLIVLDSELRIAFANQNFYRTFKLVEVEAIQRRIYELDEGRWNIPRLRELLEQVLPRKRRYVDFEVEHEFPRIGRLRMRVNARQLNYASESLILLALTGVKDLS